MGGLTVKIRYFDFYADEWIAGTVGLSLADEGLYIRACALIYSHGGPIPIEHLKKACREDHGHTVNASLRRLVEAGKLSSNGGQIDSKRCSNEIQKACKRIANGRQNASKRWKNNDLTNATPSSRSNGPFNYQPERKKDLAPKELNPVFLSSREATSPLPSQGDGAAASRSTKVESAAPAEPDPPTKAEGAAAFKRCIDAINGKLGVLDSGAGVPPPPDPRLVEFRERLSRLNTLAGTKLRGELRMQAWEVLTAADSLADPHALSPAMLAELDAIERLGVPGQWAEAAE
jgi:uncharacterized protein YdaU (DUF1376 family)